MRGEGKVGKEENKWKGDEIKGKVCGVWGEGQGEGGGASLRREGGEGVVHGCIFDSVSS